MEYKRSKALYLGLLAGMAITAGITHHQDPTSEIRIRIDTSAASSQSMQVLQMNQAQTITTNQNEENNEEAEVAAAVVLDMP